MTYNIATMTAREYRAMCNNINANLYRGDTARIRADVYRYYKIDIYQDVE
jgi:hypothetical protein